MSGLTLDCIPAGEEVTFHASTSAPQEKGSYTYAVTITTTERYASPAVSTTIKVKGSQTLKIADGVITLNEYNENGTNFEKQKIEAKWEKGKCYKNFLESIASKNNMKYNLLKELNKENNYSETDTLTGNTNGSFVSLTIVIRKKNK